MYQAEIVDLCTGMTQHPAIQRTTMWANAHDVDEVSDDTVIDLALARVAAANLAGQQGVLIEVDDHEQVRSAMLQTPNEVGTWSLEYLGPGFHVQLRIARRNRQARLDGWMSPALPIKVFLTSLLRQPTVLVAQVSDSGRFEFPIAPTGACRMSFATDDRGRPPATPPFWI
jgi:hypothetical protein